MTAARGSRRSSRWLLKGGASIADQAMVAGANFVLNILLGRWLEPIPYGAFALAYSVFLLLGTFHTAVFGEPMLVYGPGRYAGGFRKYIGILIAGHVAVMVPIGLLLLGASALLGRFASLEARQAMSALALAGPLILLLWLFRRAFYVILKPEWALLGAGAYLALLIGATAALRAASRITPATAFAAMGASALVVSLLLAWRLGPSWAGTGEPGVVAVARDHWKYARWAAPSAALTWIPTNVYFALLPAWAGLEATAALRALTNLVMPVTHAVSALSLLLLPVLVRGRSEGGMRRVAARFLPLSFAAAAIYYAVLVLSRGEIVRILYGGRYAEIVPMIPVVGLIGFLAGPLSLLGAALRALERPDKIFWSYLASSAVAVGSVVLLARTAGVAGAVWGILLSASTTVAMMALLLRAGVRARARPA